MKILKIAGIVVILFSFVIISTYVYMGGLTQVRVNKGTFGPIEMIYTTYQGPYSGLGMAWETFQKSWEEAGVEECDGLAIYLDPPDTPPDKLRSVLGCRIDMLSLEKRSALKEFFPVYSFPQVDALLSAFPFKNMASYFLGPMKVYPEMQKQLAGMQPLVAIEHYGIQSRVGVQSKEIRFVMPLNLEKEALQPIVDSFNK